MPCWSVHEEATVAGAGRSERETELEDRAMVGTAFTPVRTLGGARGGSEQVKEVVGLHESQVKAPGLTAAQGPAGSQPCRMT